MKFKVVGKSLILTDISHKITEGENSFDTVEITIPNSHDDCDLTTLSFRFSEISKDSEKSAVQILSHTKCDEKYIYLKGMITSDFSAITGKVIFMLTGVNGENVVAKFQSAPYTISDDISLTSLPDVTAAEQLFNQTQLEVQKAIDAANRAEIASQTPAPAEIYPATVEKLGGVKVDGKTITASSDGTISAKEVQNLAVQIAHPNNFLIYDNAGKPSVMVAIPKFYLDEVIDGASHTVHPAFIINGVEQDVIYISKYQNIVENDKAYSLPMKDPAVNINFDQAWNYCKNKGNGWHLMTNAEWAAIALWCKKNGTMPKGNNYYGKDISEIDLPQKAVPSFKYNNQIWRVLTGSGPVSWYHNADYSGITDLVGNILQWINGFRLYDGEIQIIANNDAADSNISAALDSDAWKAVLPDGTLASPGTKGTLKYSNVYSDKMFDEITVTPELSNSGAILLESIGLISNKAADYYGDAVTTDTAGEHLPFRGLYWNFGEKAGLFSFYAPQWNTRSFSNYGTGFRSAYFKTD